MSSNWVENSFFKRTASVNPNFNSIIKGRRVIVHCNKQRLLVLAMSCLFGSRSLNSSGKDHCKIVGCHNILYFVVELDIVNKF